MPQIARLIGGAGTGKTTELLSIMSRVIDSGIDPRQIGFVSFTRAARGEAASRAAEQFGCKVEDLEREGWFRTLHALCYRQTGVGKSLLADNKADRGWLEGACGESVDTAEEDSDASGMGVVTGWGKTPAARVLATWSAARCRMVPLRVAYDDAVDRGGDLPDFGYCSRLIDRYELHKSVDGRVDFVDLLGLFAGVGFAQDGPRDRTPVGDVPPVPVWFFDEQQDASRLLDRVCRRLISSDACRWVYVVGDPFQSIYGFAGADASCFRSWEANAERIMPQSWRCPACVHDLGERILEPCADYFDRKIKPAPHDGEISEETCIDGVLSQVDPRQSWLLLARTNYQAQRFANLLNVQGIPWRPTKGNGGWSAPVRNRGLGAIMQLADGWPIGPDEWQAALGLIPTKGGGKQLLVRGVKSLWADGFKPESELCELRDLGNWGATADLQEIISGGAWVSLIDGAEKYTRAARRFGIDATEESGIRVGTVHSVKGSEADNVAVLSTISAPIARGMEAPGGMDEERRVSYVAVTRTRRRLIVVNEPRERYRMILD